jgi:tRNA 5-methylaminomethyl-2-thiouridine biosynthesis bifunctional protein
MNIPNILLNDRYNDRYFDVVDALSEAKQIHIGNARVIERINGGAAGGAQKKVFRIGETGFGAGRLLVALLDSLAAGSVRGAVIDYNTVEMYPVSVERMGRMLGIFEDRAAPHIRCVVDAYSRIDVTAPGFHTAAISGDYGVVNLNLYVGEAMEMAEALCAPCAAWFLDGHAPKKNPDIWRAELMSAIGAKTEMGGTATAFTVAGHVRRALSAAGFSVEKVEGCGGKKEALLGTFVNKKLQY